MTISISRQNRDRGRSQIGSRVRRRMLFLLSTQVHMAFGLWGGGVECSPLGACSKGPMVHLTSFATLRRLKLGRDWGREVQWAYMLSSWACHGGSRLNETNPTPMLGLQSTTSLGSSSKCQMHRIPSRRPSRNETVKTKVKARKRRGSLCRNEGMCYAR